MFGNAAGAALAPRTQAQGGHGTFHFKSLFMGLTAGVGDAIAGHGQAPGLQHFLQRRLGVLGPLLGGGAAETVFGGESANVLSKMTTTLTVILFILSFGLYLGFVAREKPVTKALDDKATAPVAAPAAPAAATAPAAAPAATAPSAPVTAPAAKPQSTPAPAATTPAKPAAPAPAK